MKSVAQAVVLLHGLARSARSMRPMERMLRREGFEPINIGYPSTRYDIETLASLVRTEIARRVAVGRRIHFVTHSMGGILLRQMRKLQPFENLGRTVMLAPPNQGSEVVDAMRAWRFFRWINGPAGQQLGTGPDGIPTLLGPVDFEVGILAGNRSVNLLLSLLIPGPNDGKVAIARAGLPGGQKAFKVIPASHPFIMRSREAQENALAFLKDGAFLPS